MRVRSKYCSSYRYDPNTSRRFLLVNCAPTMGVSLDLNVHMRYAEASSSTLGLWATFTLGENNENSS